MKTKIWLFPFFSLKTGVYSFLTLILCYGLGFWLNNGYAACQEISFGDNQSFCFDIKKTNTDFFHAEISNIKWNLQRLTCSLILPNDDRVELKKCSGDFRYTGSEQKIELTANLDERYYILVSNYDFINGGFGSQASNTIPYAPYQNFQIYFENTSAQRNNRNQPIDTTLRVRNTGTSNEYFQWNIDLKIEKRNGSAWISASNRDFRLEYSSLHFSSIEKGEKRLTSFLSFSNEGEYRLLATIRNTQASASQNFYISNTSYTSSTTNNYYNNTYYHSSNHNTNNQAFNYSTKERSKLRAVYSIRPDIIRKLKDQYPKLRNSSYWQYSSDEMYHHMHNALNQYRNAKFSSWQSFYNAFSDWLNLTLRTR